jgi:hypothetical protein
VNGKVEDHHASVYLVRDGKMQSTKVQIGSDNGVRIEVLDGLSTNDEVVAHYTGPVGNNVPVEVAEQRKQTR